MFKCAYTKVLGNKPGERIGLVKQGEDGYYLTTYDTSSMTVDEVDELIYRLNEQLGIPPDVAKSATYGSLFGWHVPAAELANRFFDNLGKNRE